MEYCWMAGKTILVTMVYKKDPKGNKHGVGHELEATTGGFMRLALKIFVVL